ncbi:hypothetical protein E3U23_05290 [Erythrobacter litoralis]|nr:hypothetical protein [Erythrobacter litoralis]
MSLTYLWRHGRLPDLKNPKRFTELVQRRKLVDRDPRMPLLVNKVTAKTVASRLFGEDWTIPTIWTGTTLPTEPDWLFPVIVKASHGCNQNVICHDCADLERARKHINRWPAKSYGLWLDEWAYRSVPRGLIVEPYLGEGPILPVDYKIYVFSGVAALIQVHVERNSNHRWILFDREWNQISQLNEASVPAPQNLDSMISNAERIAEGFDFARVDFYEIDGKPKFGEVTFYPGSGLDPFEPAALDEKIGELWLRSSQRRNDVNEAPSSKREAA